MIFKRLVFIGAFVFLIVTLIAFSLMLQQKKETKQSQKREDFSALFVRSITENQTLRELPSVKARLALYTIALETNNPIIPLKLPLQSTEAQAQTTTLSYEPLLKNFRTPQGNERGEVFTVAPARATELGTTAQKCRDSCYKLEVYNYARNTTYTILVNTQQSQVVDLTTQKNFQPEIPDSLKQLAIELAVSSPQVTQALGYTPDSSAPVMANTKTSLRNTACERSNHLCVAPTFIKENRALWAIVDLTAYELAGVAWTDIGSVEPLTEKRVQNQLITEEYCKKSNTLERDGWKFDYQLTSSDGLRAANISYQGEPVIKSIKLVDWHVNYSNSQNFGYSDAVGCPFFSQSAVLAFRPPVLKTIYNASGESIGFKLDQYFESELWPQPCNYYYEQEYEFYKNGDFRPVVASIGRGCGDDGTYRPVTRIAFEGAQSIAKWQDGTWKPFTQEGYFEQLKEPVNADLAQLQVMSSRSTYLMSPSFGQFTDPNKTWVHVGDTGDNAFIYFSRYKEEEGERDLATIGPCCNTDYQQGPEKFLNNEVLDGELVVWYVPQLKNNGTPSKEYCWANGKLVNGLYEVERFPCHSGPLFRKTPRV